jgi:hypothetical protein
MVSIIAHLYITKICWIGVWTFHIFESTIFIVFDSYIIVEDSLLMW